MQACQLPKGTIEMNAAEDLASRASDAGSVGTWGDFGYLDDTSRAALVYMFEHGAGSEPQARFRMVRKPVADIRRCRGRDRPQLDVQGFELVHAPSAVSDFWSDDEVRRLYYAEVRELVLQVTGASRAFVFDHQCRRRESGRPPLGFGRWGDGTRPAAVGRVHNDYTDGSGAARLSTVVPDGGAAQASTAYCIVNVWRPIIGPVADTPLALCDARTVHAGDLHACEVRYPQRRGEIYVLTDSPRHRWSYCSDMRPAEAWVFKQYDSRVSGVSRVVPHAAFDLPLADAAATPLRQSIEVRCLVTFDDGGRAR